ncbi:AraC family transcriptional regulator [Flavobacterium rakeshii]|uniref:AraC family transcriptional regulator n=1 Tax=Flavobacterium rakeshii TaxID=1038845 RepID=UPI002E7B34BD|nr:AraC family transcriptional regulator [Flavobacterium rakeshii]MEE1896994.1 AraC family transcriptional regulator [Flavobacterium rakeshii]
MVSNGLYKLALPFLILLYCLNVNAKQFSDSLQLQDYHSLFSLIRNTRDNSIKQHAFLEAFLHKAKAEGDWEMIMNAYKNYADYADENSSIAYCDSMVYTAKQSRKNKLIGSAYLSKGIAYYAFKRHELALQNYLLAKPFIDVAGDDYLNYKLKYNIAHVKYYLGKNAEAIALFESCLQYFSNTNERAYLNTLHSLGLCYTKESNFGKSEQMVALALEEAIRLNNHEMDAYFLHLDGQNCYFRRNFALAIEKLKLSKKVIAGNGDYANVAVANFYIGKSYWDMKRYSQSVPYLEKVAQIFQQKQYIRPDLRENFELLIKYHKNKKELKQVLFYVDELLKADSLLLGKHSALFDSINKNYDTKELIHEKQKIEKTLSDERSRKKTMVISFSLLLTGGAIMLSVYERNRRRQNRIFRELLREGKSKEEGSRSLKNDVRDLGIAKETVEKILRLLEKWEEGKRYLETDITRTSMAVYLQTNVHYVSDIIMYYRGKSFPEYVNDLKVEYVIQQLKTDKLKRLYTHDALAKEAGFSTTQRFVQAFKSRTGLSPNFFSAKIKKELNVTHKTE